jgi:hypothetical protein
MQIQCLISWSTAIKREEAKVKAELKKGAQSNMSKASLRSLGMFPLPWFSI